MYVYVDKQMAQTRIRTGITDGTYTELLGDGLAEGTRAGDGRHHRHDHDHAHEHADAVYAGRRRGVAAGSGGPGGGGPRGMFDR